MSDSGELGQFIPIHYHYAMLYDDVRMDGFNTAINYAVKDGAKVLELGSGTGVLSFFAAQKASKVYSVEMNKDLVNESRRFLSFNTNGDKVEVIHGDAFEYLPPEPVDVVICEMLHVGLLREKQLAVIDSFKRRYLKHFGGPLPAFIPEATIQAVQPINHFYDFEGFYAPVILFQHPYAIDTRTTELGEPVIYHQVQYGQNFALSCDWSGVLTVDTEGTLNALRFATKNVLAIIPEEQSSISWHNQYMVLPLEKELEVVPGQKVAVSWEYNAGDPLTALRPVIVDL
ncbi:MAG: methyltransferase domain-containing protein [Treponema sp.]|nr:methyltransferase domain-containing protein [Treponema sp.]